VTALTGYGNASYEETGGIQMHSQMGARNCHIYRQALMVCEYRWISEPGCATHINQSGQIADTLQEMNN